MAAAAAAMPSTQPPATRLTPQPREDDSPPPSAPPFTVGDRLRVGAPSPSFHPSHPPPAATVRYVGPVTGETGTWVGLEWDDAGRGRHDGSVVANASTTTGAPPPGERTRYFTVRATAPTAGSFVREAKLASVAVRGVGLLEGVRAQYCGGSGTTTTTTPAAHHPPVVAGAAELAARQADLAALTTASVAGSAVCGLGGDGDDARAAVASALRSLVDLDAGATLIPHWPAACELGRALPRLTRLCLDRCGLGAGEAGLVHAPPAPAPRPVVAFPSLRTLVLARTGLGWAALLHTVAASAPALESVSLAHCGLEGLDTPPPPGALARLTALDLGGNGLRDWGSLAAALAPLPALASLDLTGNAGLGAGGLAEAAATAPALTCLATLRVAGCGIASWADVAALVGGEGGPPRPACPALSAVRLTDNPLPPFSVSAGSHRADLVARLPARLARLNGAAVSERERAAAVRDLTRAKELAAGSAAAAPPPRPPLAATLVPVTLHLPNGTAHAVRLPASTTVARLRMVVSRLSGGRGSGGLCVAPAGEGRDSPSAQVLTAAEEGRDLGWLGVGSGAEVWVGVA